MSTPYITFQIDQLEAETERALREGDREAQEDLKDELLERRPGPRVQRLLQLLAKGTGSAPGPHAMEPHSGGQAGGHGPADSRPGPARGRPDTPAPRAKRPAFRPTPEQEQAVAAFRTGQSLKINAYAGSGKTSTLQLLAHSTRRKGQYLAFNRKIVDDSAGRFPPEVYSCTTHSLAFRSLRHQYSAGKLTGSINANHLVELLGLRPWRIDRNHVLAARSQAFLIQSTIRRFCQSDAADFLPEHVPRHGSLAVAPENVLREATALALNGARHLWARMRSPDDSIPLGHDGYLKAWALSAPRLPVDYILLDEAQDTTPVVLGVLGGQQAQIVYVGDRYQQIYAWRGAINAMEQAQAVHCTDLTISFRFGGEVAWAANRVLELLKASKPLNGNRERRSRIAGAPDGTVLARTNASVITAVIEALDEGRRPHLVGGTAELKAMLWGVQDLKAGRPSAVPEFFGFESWQQLLEFVRSDEGGELVTFVNLVEARGEKQLLWALDSVADEEQCDFVVSTAHKAKGREWDQVRLMDDFLRSLPSKEPPGQSPPGLEPAELRLLYVALTRARQVLDVPPGLMEFLTTGQLPAKTAVPQPAGRPATPIPPWTPPTSWTPPEPTPGEGPRDSQRRAAPRRGSGSSGAARPPGGSSRSSSPPGGTQAPAGNKGGSLRRRPTGR